MASIPSSCRDAYVARFARVCAGAGATAGATLLGLAAMFGADGLSSLLVQQLLMVPAAYALAVHFGRLRLAHALELPLRRTGDLRGDIARLEGYDPAQRVRVMADALEYRSLMLPLVGLVVLLPLGVHLLVAQGIGLLIDDEMSRLAAFDHWIAMSFATLGQCFAIVAWKSRRYARRLRETATSSLPTMGEMADSAPWEVVAAASAAAIAGGVMWVAVQGAFAMSLVPALSAFAVGVVGLTGVAVVPPLFTWAHRRLLSERRALGT